MKNNKNSRKKIIAQQNFDEDEINLWKLLDILLTYKVFIVSVFSVCVIIIFYLLLGQFKQKNISYFYSFPLGSEQEYDLIKNEMEFILKVYKGENKNNNNFLNEITKLDLKIDDVVNKNKSIYNTKIVSIVVHMNISSSEYDENYLKIRQTIEKILLYPSVEKILNRISMQNKKHTLLEKRKELADLSLLYKNDLIYYNELAESLRSLRIKEAGMLKKSSSVLKGIKNPANQEYYEKKVPENFFDSTIDEQILMLSSMIKKVEQDNKNADIIMDDIEFKFSFLNEIISNEVFNKTKAVKIAENYLKNKLNKNIDNNTLLREIETFILEPSEVLVFILEKKESNLKNAFVKFIIISIALIIILLMSIFFHHGYKNYNKQLN
ncbi:MAG: hypothetical protein OEZ22_05015 [Spirochaetia bacterium]|nr:hypothetical protein [Spirochaetia bacterium]